MDPNKRDAIMQMFRHDVSSGNIGLKIKMPGEEGRDELNDMVNYVPTSEYKTYDTGRRDAAGNPVMSSELMDLLMAPPSEPKDSSDGIFSNITDFVYDAIQDKIRADSAFVSSISSDSPAPGDAYLRYLTAGEHAAQDMANAGTTKDWLKDAMPESFQESRLYADFFYGDEEKRDLVKKAHDLTGIRAETITNDPEVWEKVMKVVQRAEKLKKTPGMVNANGDLDMNKVFKEMPYLKEIIDKRGTNEAVMMLHHTEGLQTVSDAYSTEFTRFLGNIGRGLEGGWYNLDRQWTHAKAMVGRRALYEDEKLHIAELDKKQERLPEYSYGGVGQALGAMIGGAVENLPMLASSQGAGAITGGITLAITKNPTIARNVGRATAIAIMALEIGGSQYEENLSKLDAKGRAMYTTGEAAALSATQGLAEGIIEQVVLQKIARTIFGRGDAKALRDLYAGAGAKDLALAAEGASAQEAARTLIKDRILGAAKAGAITFNVELQEEFAQQVSDMALENMAQVAFKGTDAEISSVSKILQKSTAAAIEAAPSIMGFGLIGFGGHMGAHTRPMLNARSHMENLIKDRLYRSVNENQHLMNTVEAVGDNLKNVQELQGKAPDLVNEMLDSQNRRYGMETTSVDIISLHQEEGGAELVQEIAEANKISPEELQACADGTGMLPVKTSTLQQMTARLDGAKRKALFQNITKSADLFTDKQAQNEAELVKEVLKAFQSKTEDEAGDAIDRYVESAFKEHGQRALARDVLLADVNHPAAEIKRRMNRLDADLKELTSTAQNDGSAESVAYFDSIKPEIEKINVQKAALEEIKDTIKSLQPGDVVATAALSPEARGIYHGLADQLGNAKSKKVRAAARANALLAARYAERMAAIYSEVKGESYTAADYMRDHLRVDARAEGGRSEGLHQAAMKRSDAVNLKDFSRMMRSPDAESGSRNKKFLRMIAHSGAFVDVAQDDMIHMHNHHPEMTDEDFAVIQENMENFLRVHQDMTEKGDYGGKSILCKIKTPRGVAGVSYELLPMGRIFLKTAFFDNENGIDNWITKNGTSKDLMNLETEKRGNAASMLTGHPSRTAGAADSLTPSVVRPLSLPMIQEMLGVVNSKETFQQSAWHGSPYSFDTFDLGAIGTGEGAQAHGWGLYFAKDRKVSEGYRRRVTASVRAKRQGSPISRRIEIDGVDYVSYKGDTGVYNEATQEPIRNTPISWVFGLIRRADAFSEWGTRTSKKEMMQKIEEKMHRFEERAKEAEINIKKMEAELANPEATRKGIIRDDIFTEKNHIRWFEEFKQGYDVLKNSKWSIKSRLRKKQEPLTPLLYEVDIPDEDVLLDEKKTLNKQPLRVREGIKKYYESRPDDYIAPESADALGESTGERFLKDVIFQMRREGSENPEKDASLLLNECGIKGITYNGNRDGRCYVIFDDKAISIIEKYNQEMQRGVIGRISTAGGARTIELMKTADQSTFMHEMAHNYLFDLQHIAELAPDSRHAKDLATIQKWASWTKGMANQYAGTAAAEEFRAREEKILAAEKKGDAAEAERLKHEWMQERFARGFEEYLRSGDAPAQGLRAVFRRFKAWLTRIYKDVTGAGVRASAEVEAIMARMIATEEEIEAAAVVKRAQRLQKIDPELLNADSAETMIQWETEAKERAKETLLKELIREMEERDVDAHMKEYEEQLKAEMRESPVWQAEAVAETFGVGQVIASGYYPSVEAYEKALEEAGGGYDAVYKSRVRAEKARYKAEMPNAEAIAERAEEALATEEYTARQTALEGEILNEYTKAYDNAPKRLKDAMISVARALEREEDAPLEKAVNTLKYAFRWQEKQAQEIDDLRALLSASEENRAKMREKFEEAFNRLKLSAAKNLDAVRSLRDSASGRVAAMRAYAMKHLEDAPIHEATNTRHWMRQVQQAAKETERHLTNMLRKNNGIEKEDTGEKDFAAARDAKTRQLAMEAMTHESVKLKRELARMVKYFARREKNLANDKSAKIDGNHRYFIHHLLYVFGLRRSDGVPLAGDGARSWAQLIAELKSDKSDLDGVDIPEWLTSAVTSRDPQRKYTKLSMQELRDLRTLVEFLYVTGRNKNTLLTSGENVDEVAARIYQDYEEHLGAQDGGREAHAYMVQLLKPETMLKIIGGKEGAIVHYIYNTLFDAQEKKTEALEKNAKRLEAIIGQYYTQKDRHRAKKKKLGITLTDGTELTKENVLSMALNWGNEGNRSRLIAGISTKTPYTEKDMEEIFAKTLTKKDWAFVQEIWDYLNEYGDAVNEVVEKSTGTPMKRVAPDAFTIVDAATKETLTIRGGYYPIRYDPKGSWKAADQELTSVAESVGGAMAFGAGMGSTKNRASGPSREPMPLSLSLDVMYRHIDQQIHIATMRLACRDVYKLLNHSAVKAPVLQTLGQEAYKELKRWIENTWHEPMDNNLYIENKAEEWRKNTVTAIMAFRVSTALLNVSNIAPMADRLGTVNAILAMLQYLRHPQKIRRFVLNDSAFMRNRAHNMDRDLNTKGEDIFGGKSSVRKFIVKYSTWLIEETDMLCSVPTYYWTYQQRYNKEVLDGTDEVIARERAHREAHEAVRSIFGSSDAIDRSAVQRSQRGIVKAFTPFFSFFNAQMNAVWEKYYAGKYDQHKKKFVERYAEFVRSYLFRFVAMAAIDTLVRMTLEDFAAGSGDKKDKDEWYKRFLRQWMASSIGSVTSGFPFINAVGEIAQGMITGKLQQGRSSGVVFTAVGRLTDPIQMAYSLQKENSKIDAIDFGRVLTKGYLGTVHAVPDTLTDGFWNTARFMHDNYHFNNTDDLREFFAKTLLDKKLKQK